MKAFWLTGTLFFTVLILLVAFENISATCSYVRFLFYEVGSEISPTFTFFGIALLGAITGIFLMGLFNSLFQAPREDEEEGGASTMQ